MGRPRKYESEAEKQRAYRQRCKLRNAPVTIGQNGFNFSKTILSLFDYSGSWSKPYRDAGYNVIQIDLKHGHDVRLLKVPDLPPIHGILAAPPCTEFAVSGARWWEAKGEAALLEGLALIDATIRIVTMTRPKWWVLENPVGRLKDYLGEPRMYFNPCDYGDPYTKKTGLWGEFNDALPVTPVEATEGSKMHLKYGGKSDRTKEARSITPAGFAMAFYQVNP